jgi:NhaP-type Na+/H+ or K+/H+ antiporter
MQAHVITILAGISVIALASQWIAWAVRLPAILFLLVAGMIAGPVTGWLDPDVLFGDLLFPLVALSVAVILFEGALTLDLQEIRGHGRVVRNLVSIGLAVTWLITTLAAHYLVDFEWPIAVLFGAVTVVTGPTVIVPMLRTVRPNAAVANVLRWEGIVIDPIGALLAVLVFQFIISGRGGAAFGDTLLNFGVMLAIGIVLGVAAGQGLGVVLRRHWLPEYLHNVGTLAVVFGVFALSDALKHESGLLTVTVMGMWLANMRDVHIDEILDFKESLSVLLISGLFIILAARIDPGDFTLLGWGALGVFLVIQFIARPAKVLVSAWGSKLTWRERGLLAWIAPRGIVAAAVAALFALRMDSAEDPILAEQADLLVPLTFVVILGTVVLQSATARLVAIWLKVAEPVPRGLLIVGANPVARAIGKALVGQHFVVVLTDTVWRNVHTARMDGLNVYYGNPASEHADRNLNLIGIGRLLALSPHGELNALANLKYRVEFGRDKVYTIQTAEDELSPEQLRVGERLRGYTLFGEDVTYSKLATMLSEGGEIRSTKLSESFDFDAYQSRYKGKAVPLFAVTPTGKLETFVAGGKLEPGEGWTLLALLPEKEAEEVEAAAEEARARRAAAEAEASGRSGESAEEESGASAADGEESDSHGSSEPSN